MKQHVFGRRRVAGGLTCMAAGALVLATGLGPAGATEGPQIERGSSWSLDELSERFGGQWDEAEVPLESGRYVLDDRGTADGGDDAYVDVTVDGDSIDWEAEGIDIGAVEVPEGEESTLYTFGNGHGSRRGHDLSWGGHGDRGRGDRGHGDRGHGWGHGGSGWRDHGDRGDRGDRGHGIRFCWKKRGGGHDTTTSTVPESTTTTEAPEETTTTEAPEETTTTEAPEETTTTEAPEETTTTEAPTTTLPETSGELPRTGSTTMPLAAGAGTLLAVGVAAVVGKRYLQQRV